MINTHILTLKVNGRDSFDGSNPVRLIFTPATVSISGHKLNMLTTELVHYKIYCTLV